MNSKVGQDTFAKSSQMVVAELYLADSDLAITWVPRGEIFV